MLLIINLFLSLFISASLFFISYFFLSFTHIYISIDYILVYILIYTFNIYKQLSLYIKVWWDPILLTKAAYFRKKKQV